MNPGIEFIFAIEAAMLLSLNFQCYGKTENCLYKSVALQNSISGQPVPFPLFSEFLLFEYCCIFYLWAEH